MVTLWNRADHIYFHAVVCSFFFFPRLISAAADWMSAILPHTCEFKMQVWNLLHAGRKKSPKIAIWAPSHNFVGLCLRN